MEKDLISIIMPFRNTALFLPDCIESIRAQTYQNWELIAIDDFSTDHSKSILDLFASKDKRIKLISNVNRGIIGALQVGSQMAKGEFITRMDSDDIMMPDKLHKMHANLIRCGHKHVAIGPVKYFSHESAISEGYQKYEEWLNALTAEGKNYEEIYKECVIPSPSWLCFRTEFDQCGGFEHHVYPEDYDLTFRFYEFGLKCIPETSILHHWRDYSSRTSRTSENYANNTFLELKTHYFLKLHHDPKKTILIWGAGSKGKKVAKILLAKGIHFKWVCENPNKLGKDIYGRIMESLDSIKNWNKHQSIITVANPDEQQKIKAELAGKSLVNLSDYFFFC